MNDPNLNKVEFIIFMALFIRILVMQKYIRIDRIVESFGMTVYHLLTLL